MLSYAVSLSGFTDVRLMDGELYRIESSDDAANM